MSGADGISGPGRTGAPEAGPPDPGATRRGPHDRWLVALVVLAVALLVAAVVIAWIELRGDDEPEPAAAATTSEPTTTTSEPTTTTSATPTEPGEATPGPSEAAPGGEPLPDLVQRFDGSGPVTSDVPESEGSLQDGGFFALLHGVDAQARTISVDIALFYGGQAATDWLAENDPERAEEGPPENDYIIVNDVERVRELQVSPSVRVGRWCFDGGVVTQEQTFEAWATAEPEVAPTTACSEPGRQGNELYWIDVRDGVVLQITGQYVP